MTLFPKHTGTNREIPKAKVIPQNPCSRCKGKGRYKTGHSFGSGNIYSRCFACNGTGESRNT